MKSSVYYFHVKTEILDDFQIYISVHLIEAAMKVSIPDLWEQLYEIVEYAKKTISLARFSCLVTWSKIFTAPRCKGESPVILMIRLLLLFTVPVSNAKLKRIFSKLKRVQVNFCCSLSVRGLENILRIREVGSGSETYDPMSAIKKWSINKVKNATKENGPRSYKSCDTAEVNIKSHSDDDSFDEEGNISENGDEDEYSYSSDSEYNSE